MGRPQAENKLSLGACHVGVDGSTALEWEHPEHHL